MTGSSWNMNYTQYGCHVFISILLLPLYSCSQASEGSGASQFDPQLEGIPIESAGMTFAQAFCNKYKACDCYSYTDTSSGADAFTSDSNCLTVLSSRFDEARRSWASMSENQGRSAEDFYDGTCLANIIAALDDFDCRTWSLTSTEILAAQGRTQCAVFVGDRGPGSRCNDSEECQRGLACFNVGHEERDKRCIPLPLSFAATGEPCSRLEGRFCALESSSCVDGLCVALPSDGDPCRRSLLIDLCAPSHYCQWSALDKQTCRPRAQEGETCPQPDACANNQLYCDNMSQTCRSKPSAVGGECAGHFLCTEDLVCRNETCGPRTPPICGQILNADLRRG